MISSYTGRPSRTIKTRVWQSQASILLGLKLKINNSVCQVERRTRNIVARCFNCQGLGHTIKNCKRQAKCVICAGNHWHSFCQESVKCANCEGPHKASSLNCPSYTLRHERIASKYAISQHIAGTVNRDNEEA